MSLGTGRPLFISLRADTKGFGRALSQAEKRTAMFKKVATTAGLAIAGAFSALAVSAVKAAAEDQASQVRLAKSLKNTTKATDAQVKAVEAQITKMQFATGVSDDKLRKAYQRLATSTKDLGKAQDLTNLALDVSAASGKDVESVAMALGKAYDGNTGALKRLGLSLDPAILKSKDFTAIQAALASQTAGASAAAADTFAGKLAILNQRFNEAKENIGSALIPWLTRLATAVNDVAKGFSGEKGLAKRTKEASDALSAARDAKYENSWFAVGASLKSVATSFSNMYEAMSGNKSTVDSIKTISNALQTLANGINAVTNAYKEYVKFRNTSGVKQVLDAGDWLSKHLLRVPTLPTGRATGGNTMNGRTYLVGERGPELFTSPGGTITPTNRLTGNGQTIVNITMNGIVDGESARRSIENLIQRSARRTGPVNWAGASI